MVLMINAHNVPLTNTLVSQTKNYLTELVKTRQRQANHLASLWSRPQTTHLCHRTRMGVLPLLTA